VVVKLAACTDGSEKPVDRYLARVIRNVSGTDESTGSGQSAPAAGAATIATPTATGATQNMRAFGMRFHLLIQSRIEQRWQLVYHRQSQRRGERGGARQLFPGKTVRFCAVAFSCWIRGRRAVRLRRLRFGWSRIRIGGAEDWHDLVRESTPGVRRS
jgi:hypothetical protein